MKPCRHLAKKGSSVTPCFSKPNLLRRMAKAIEPLTMPRLISPPKSDSPLTARLNHLGTEYVDSYVLHGPHQRRGLGKRIGRCGRPWKVSIESGKTKMIGISNITAAQLTELCEQANVKPMVVQNRCFAALGWDKEVREICQAHGIIYQGFSLLTANRRSARRPGNSNHRATRIRCYSCTSHLSLCHANRHAAVDRNHKPTTHERRPPSRATRTFHRRNPAD